MKKLAILLLMASRMTFAEPVVHLAAAPDQAVQAVLQDLQQPQTVPLPAEPEEEPEDGGSLVPS